MCRVLNPGDLSTVNVVLGMLNALCKIKILSLVLDFLFPNRDDDDDDGCISRTCSTPRRVGRRGAIGDELNDGQSLCRTPWDDVVVVVVLRRLCARSW